MPTLQQLVRHRRKRRTHKKKNRALQGCPQARAVVLSVTVDKPKKPNSAQRKVVVVTLQKTNVQKRVYVPGEGHNLQQHSIVLVRGGSVRDLPGVRYKVVRGAKGYDLQPPCAVNGEPGGKRQQARSKYGQKKADAHDVAKKRK